MLTKALQSLEKSGGAHVLQVQPLVGLRTDLAEMQRFTKSQAMEQVGPRSEVFHLLPPEEAIYRNGTNGGLGPSHTLFIHLQISEVPAQQEDYQEVPGSIHHPENCILPYSFVLLQLVNHIEDYSVRKQSINLHNSEKEKLPSQ